MRVAVVAGPDPGHAFPALALCLRLRDAGDQPVLFTGQRWFAAARAAGIGVRLLKGLAPRPGEDDADAGRRIHQRAAHIATEILPDLGAMLPELVVSDVLTAGGALAAERLGVPWVELSPHPLYLPSKGLPPLGSGLAPGTGWGGRIRDAVLRGLTARDLRRGARQRKEARMGLGLPPDERGPAARLIATLPALEVPRPDWPSEAQVVGPLLWEPTERIVSPPPGEGPLVLVAPSTAQTGVSDLGKTVVAGVAGMGVRVVISLLAEPDIALPPWAMAGVGRQDRLLEQSAVAVCGGGHGFLAKALLHGVPVVVVPGGGDQWELANRAVRQGSSILVRPASAESIRAAIAKIIADPSYTRAAAGAARGITQVADPVAVCHGALAATSV